MHKVRSIVLCMAALGCQTSAHNEPRAARKESTPAPTLALPPIPTTTSEPPLVLEAEAASLIRDIARQHVWLGRADGLFWAPFDCRAPPIAPLFASSAQRGEHAQKVYTLYLLDPDAYARATESVLPMAPSFDDKHRPPAWEKVDGRLGEMSQVLVKESWAPAECTDENRARGRTSGSKSLCAGKAGPLFIMAFPRRSNLRTDEGWVYGTFLNDTVTSAGRVTACMGCHTHAPHGRLYGLPK